MSKEDLIIFKTLFSFSNYLSSFDGWPMVQNLRTIYFLIAPKRHNPMHPIGLQ